jgi:hypothetical protein
MEIIRHGNTYQVEMCRQCFCRFGFGGKEIIDESSLEEYAGAFHNTIYKYDKCPECNYKVIIEYNIDGEDIIMD